MDCTLVRIGSYPQRGAPGHRLAAAEITTSGVVGSRAKRNALLVVSAAEADGVDVRGEQVRANLVLDVAPHTLDAAEGVTLTIADVRIRLGRRPRGCPGRYAEVLTPGHVRVGDRVEVERGEPGR